MTATPPTGRRVWPLWAAALVAVLAIIGLAVVVLNPDVRSQPAAIGVTGLLVLLLFVLVVGFNYRRTGRAGFRSIEEIAEGLGRSQAAFDAIARLGPEAIPALSHVLARGDELAAPEAIKLLRLIGPEAAPALIRALGHSRVHQPAAEALREIGPLGPASVPALIDLLGNGDPRVRSAAADALAALGPAAAAAAPALPALFADHRVREKAVAALRAMGPAPAVPVLIAALDDQWVRDTAARALARFGEAAQSPLRELLTSSTGLDRRRGVWGLRYFGTRLTPESISLLFALFLRDSEVGSEAGLALAEAWSEGEPSSCSGAILNEICRELPKAQTAAHVGGLCGFFKRLGPRASGAIPRLRALHRTFQGYPAEVTEELLNAIDPNWRGV